MFRLIWHLFARGIALAPRLLLQPHRLQERPEARLRVQ
jgi:hypothetical protein